MKDEALHLSDCVVRWKEPGMNPKTQQRITYRRASFPKFYYDSNGQYLGVMSPTGEKFEAPWSAYLLALMQYGYEARFNNGRMSGKFDPPTQGSSGYPSAEALITTCAPKYKGSTYHFPTLSVNMRDEYHDIDGDPYLPCYVAALQQGAHLRHWDNEIQDIYPDRSEERLKDAKANLIDFPAINRDDGWKLLSNSSRRGSVRHSRVVVFAHDLTPEQEGLFLKYLAEDNCPGYISGEVKHVEDMYIFQSTTPSY